MIEFLNWLDGSTIATVILLIMAFIIAWLIDSLLSAKSEIIDLEARNRLLTTLNRDSLEKMRNLRSQLNDKD